MLNKSKHQLHLTRILLSFFNDPLVGSSLGFKGGTAAALFYDLPRFSVDLDFDYLGALKKDWKKLDQVVAKITQLVEKTYAIEEKNIKRNTLFWLLSYGKGEAKIKVEISTRKFNNTYSSQNYYGVQIPVLRWEDMAAHKLVAAMERKTIANRDLFDAHFFLDRVEAVDINFDLVKDRTDLNRREFLKKFLDFVEKVDNRKILEGLGEVLDQSQKDWVKAKLLENLKQLIRIQLGI